MKRISIVIVTLVVIGGLFLLASQFVDTGSAGQNMTRVDSKKLIKDYNAKIGPADAKVTVVKATSLPAGTARRTTRFVKLCDC